MGQGQQSPYAQGRRGNQGLAVPTEVPWCVLLRGHHVSRPNHTAVLADALLIHLALPQRFSHKPRRCPLSAISVLPPKPWCCGAPVFPTLAPGPALAGVTPGLALSPLWAARGTLLPLRSRGVFPTSRSSRASVGPCGRRWSPSWA